MENSAGEKWLEVLDGEGTGFTPLVTYGGWRVGILRFDPDNTAGRIMTMEPHQASDEVFVLTVGRAVLLIGGDAPQVDRVSAQTAEAGKVYNVRMGTLNAELLSRDASRVIVESDGTDLHNSEYTQPRAHVRAEIGEIARRADLA